jgi:3-dehydroquinate synthase
MDPMVFTFGEFETEVSFPDSLDSAALAASCPAGSVAVFDTTTHALFGAKAANAVVLPAGEASKGLESVQAVLRRLVESGLGRDATVIGVGGGVVSDMAAFAASVYMRGCSLVLAPTTLLAMVDASLGGKTGIDFAGYKNLVGTFYPASRVVVAASTLASLPGREYLAGLAEVVKTAAIGDAELLGILDGRRSDVMRRDPAVMADVVRRCIAVKGAIVASDLRERGRRAVLNLGHTFAHALESCTGFSTWNHGEAVAWGIKKAVEAGLALGQTDPGFAKRILSILEAYGFRLAAGVPSADLLRAMVMDKKRRNGAIRLVVPKIAGEAVVVHAEESLVSRVLSG